uniref:Uncharacterized protein n=1 Tax=Macrostomum lignano TaxID=282301 RepID=A0A1I8FFL2_9PLAT
MPTLLSVDQQAGRLHCEPVFKLESQSGLSCKLRQVRLAASSLRPDRSLASGMRYAKVRLRRRLRRRLWHHPSGVTIVRWSRRSLAVASWRRCRRELRQPQVGRPSVLAFPAREEDGAGRACRAGLTGAAVGRPARAIPIDDVIRGRPGRRRHDNVEPQDSTGSGRRLTRRAECSTSSHSRGVSIYNPAENTFSFQRPQPRPCCTATRDSCGRVPFAVSQGDSSWALTLLQLIEFYNPRRGTAVQHAPAQLPGQCARRGVLRSDETGCPIWKIWLTSLASCATLWASGRRESWTPCLIEVFEAAGAAPAPADGPCTDDDEADEAGVAHGDLKCEPETPRSTF